jgi:hypothetical protein
MAQFSKAKNKKDIERDPRVHSMSHEIGNNEAGKASWFIILNDGYISKHSHATCIHEPTIAKCLERLNNDVLTESQYRIYINS